MIFLFQTTATIPAEKLMTPIKYCNFTDEARKDNGMRPRYRSQQVRN